MATVDKIHDRESLEAWLKGWSQEDAVQIAQRAALRVALLAWADPFRTECEGDLTRLPVLRALLTGGVAAKMPTPQVRTAAFAAAAAAVNVADQVVAVARAAARAAGHAAFAATDVAASAAAAVNVADQAFAVADAPAHAAIAAARAAAAAAAAARAGDAADQIWDQVREDARVLEAGGNLLATPLWSIPPPDWFRQAEAEMRAIMLADPAEHWGFWLRWWDGVLSGAQIDWALQEQVALIDAAIWETGAEAVRARIGLIEEKFRLRAEVGALRAELAVTHHQAAPEAWRGHNGPPELIAEGATIRREIATIDRALGDAEQELAKADPEPSLLWRIGLKICDAATTFGLYVASLSNIALRNAAAEFGKTGMKWAVGVGLTLWLTRSENVGRALMELAKALGGGG